MLIVCILGMMAPKPKKSEIQAMQCQLRDESLGTPAATEASGSLKDLGFLLDVGTL